MTCVHPASSLDLPIYRFLSLFFLCYERDAVQYLSLTFFPDQTAEQGCVNFAQIKHDSPSNACSNVSS